MLHYHLIGAMLLKVITQKLFLRKKILEMKSMKFVIIFMFLDDELPFSADLSNNDGRPGKAVEVKYAIRICWK